MRKGNAEPFADCRADHYCRRAALLRQVPNGEMQKSMQYSMQINLQIFRQISEQKPLLR